MLSNGSINIKINIEYKQFNSNIDNVQIIVLIIREM